MMTGILKPIGGVIQVNGQVPYNNRIHQAQVMGIVFGQRPQLWWVLPVIESFKILTYWVWTKGVNSYTETGS